jgi:hypothetical protein
VGGGVLRLVKAQRGAVGQRDGGLAPPVLLVHAAGELDAPGGQLGHGGVEVVAH